MTLSHTAFPAEAGERMSALARRVLLFVFVAWAVDAADSTVYSLTLPAVRTEFHLSLGLMGAIGSLFLAGSVIGSMLMPMLADRRGRRTGMVACIGAFSIFTGIVGLAPSGGTVAAGRFLTGVGAGGQWPIGAAYLSELVPARRRGFAMGLMQAGYPVGFFLAGGIVAVTTALGWGWRAAFLVLTVPVVMCVPIMIMLRETPTWIAEQSARRADAGNRTSLAVLKNLFSAEHRRTTVIATALHIFGAVFSFGLVTWVPSAITLDFGMRSGQTAGFVMLSWGVGAIGYVAAGPLSDRLGRRPTLAIYTVIGLIAVIYLNVLHHQAHTSFGALVAPGILIGVSLGVAAIYIAYTSEIYADAVRTVGLGFSVAAGKLVAVFVPVGLGVNAETTSVTTSLLVSTIAGCLMVPVILLGPETARRELTDISTGA
ncbi:MFS transporter [Nocardia jiangxiensis]|uniref:MFS transporter n=1 Tax=Nocardia jiangxiensis TaxID=282685 RepID=A0ABW6S8E8_9NOCA